MSQVEGLHHAILADLVGGRLNHDDGLIGTHDHEIEVAPIHLVQTRIEDQPVIDQTDPDRSNRPVEGDLRGVERCRSAVDGQNVRVDVRLGRQDHGDNLRFVLVVRGKERAQRAIEQATHDDFPLRGPALPFEETAGNLSGGVGIFAIIAGQGHKAAVGPRLGLGARGDEDHRVAALHESGAVRLLRQAPGFNGQFPRTYRGGYFVDHSQFLPIL